MIDVCHNIKAELARELNNILSYWSTTTLDHKNNGFYGRINHYNQIIEDATKGIILNTRILWSFAAAGNYTKSNQYKAIADRAFHYIKDHFFDKNFQGVFWELDYKGNPINKRKQIYAQAFTIYGLSEYYMYQKDPIALQLAISLFELIESKAKDEVYGGYVEAFGENWDSLSDMRLSEKDMNAAKTMNNHLHILEAYANLCRCYDNKALKLALKSLIRLFLTKFYNELHHFDLFFDEKWQLLSTTISYGHDIETSWLLLDAAHQVGDKKIVQECEELAIKIAKTFVVEALDSEGAVINEKNLVTNHIDDDRHWWPQVEAMIGLSNVYKITGQTEYLEKTLRIWEFTKHNLIDHVNGEWFFRVNNKGEVYQEEDKVSMWKAPYHSTRACIILNSIL